MTRTFSITEPHPSVPSSHYIYSGRGGAGNIARVDPSTITPGSTATGPASRTKIPASPTSAYYSSGRGGAGNVRQHKERAIFSFDEELAAQRKLMERAAPVYHIGRGGAGNFVEEREVAPQVQRKNSSDSGSSVEERRSGDSMWNRVSRTLSRN